MELILIKAVSVILMVLGLTYIAEHVSVKASGILSGLPTGSIITYIFFGIEFGTKYVQDVSLYNINGLISNLLFCVGYYISTFYKGKFKLFVSILLSLTLYTISMLALSKVEPSINTTPIFVLPLLIMAILYFVSVEDHQIEKPQKLSVYSFIARMALTILIFLVISSLPNYVPQNYAGIFSSFPIVLLPLIIIIHFNYNSYQARTIAKNAPLGLPSVVAFSTTVFYTFDDLGILLGICIALTASLVVIFIQTKLLTFYKLKILKRVQ